MTDVQMEEYLVRVRGVQTLMCIASDSGNDRLGLMHSIILPNLEPQDARIAIVAEATSAIINGGDAVALTTANRLQDLYQDPAEYIEIMDMIMETKDAWDTRQQD